MIKQDEYIQVGVTATRDPATGDFMPAVALYVKADDVARESEQALIDDIGKLFALRMKSYIEKCKQAGTAI